MDAMKYGEAIKQQIAQWHIYVLDDEPDCLFLAERTLSFFGARVKTFGTAGDALLTMLECKPTCVLTDLSMPVISGWRFLEKVRAQPNLAKVPVVAVSAHAMRGDLERVRAVGFDGYLAKPYSPLALVEMLITLLDVSVSEVGSPTILLPIAMAASR